MIVEYRAKMVGFDVWVYGSLISNNRAYISRYYIEGDAGSNQVDPDTICRKVYEEDGVKFFDRDIIAFDYEQVLPDGLSYKKVWVRRVENIQDTGLTVYVGRQMNEYAHKILLNSKLNVEIVGNMIDNPELLQQQWEPKIVESCAN